MAPAEDPSDIRVFVHWHDQTVFAGEEIRCTITFKNVAQTSEQQRSQRQPPQAGRHKLTSSLQTPRAKASASLTGPPSASTGRGHRRTALSMSVPSTSSRRGSGSIQWPSGGPGGESRPKHAHKRSVSIVSIGSVNTVDDHGPKNENTAASSKATRPMRAHHRASSLQILPRAQSSPTGGMHSAPFMPARQLSASSPHNASYPPDRFGRMRNGSSALSPTGASVSSPRRSPRGSPNPMPEFRFPAAPPPGNSKDSNEASSSTPLDDGFLSPKSSVAEYGQMPSRLKDSVATPGERPLPAARILSSTSMQTGTPRSSGEFYSVSNHSSETMASEYVTNPGRGHARPSHLRRNSSMAPQQQRSSETLMMGYAQVQGSFVLDGSLVSLGPFEQVKKKGVVGGRGGGVVGLEPTKPRESGLLKSLGWGNISNFSNSIGDFLGGGELSTIREMRGAANSKSIPLLNTPQSILFVDLQMAPGQSRTFEYVFKLPKGLPPSHKGKAVKISYSLLIGTQRPGGAKEQQVRSVDIPFRVLGSVNSAGEILGHDLMSPYVLLRDEAQVSSVGKSAKDKSHKSKASRAPATLNDFLSYVDELVTRPRDEANGQLLSPSAQVRSRRPSAVNEEITSSRDAIHFAIMRSNVASDGQQSPNRFEIARNGMRVGTVMLTRPSYRLGEVVTMAVDLTETDIPCYAIHMTLETSERVDQSLAVRSESSIQRVTRKVFVTSSDTTLYSRRVVFTPTIPISATPEFVTSGVNLEWKIRVEFVVPSQGQPSRTEDGADGEGEGLPPQTHPLLEQISQHERGGLVLAAVENLSCESFDVLVPLRVYGAVGSGLERLERDEASDEGLVV